MFQLAQKAYSLPIEVVTCNLALWANADNRSYFAMAS